MAIFLHLVLTCTIDLMNGIYFSCPPDSPGPPLAKVQVMADGEGSPPAKVPKTMPSDNEEVLQLKIEITNLVRDKNEIKEQIKQFK